MSTVVVDSTNAVVQEGSHSLLVFNNKEEFSVTTNSTETILSEGSATTIVTSPAPASTVVQSGLMGPITSGSDKHYRHDQFTASDTWTIVHGLDKYPSITIVDSAGDEVEGAVNYLSITTVVVTFSAAFSGSAFLN